ARVRHALAAARGALVGGDRSLTYAELARRIRRLANGLRRLGVGRGDRVAWLGAHPSGVLGALVAPGAVGGGGRVAWLGPNHPAFLESLFASGLLGAALAPVNHRLSADGIRAFLADTEASGLIENGATDPNPKPRCA